MRSTELTLSGPRSADHLLPLEPGAQDTTGLARDVTRLPPSYRTFIAHAGWGRLFGLWLVHPPTRPGFCDDLAGRGGELTDRLRADFLDSRAKGFDWVIEPDGAWEVTQRLTVFGWSENGDYLAWDTGSAGPDGEMPVWPSARGQNLRLLGATLDEALPVLRELADGFADQLGADVEPLAPSPL